jgi:uncharacterized protein with ParB-like and HNH nuclease domain
MPYQSETIATAVHRLNSQYFLPALQREFVWQPEPVIQLFDSIMRGYPISSFLFWELKQENRDKWEIYRFIDSAKQGGTHNQQASTDGINQLTLVLDGQQRLTALLIGLKGAYTIKKKYKRRGDPDAWITHRLYLDLLKDPKIGEDELEIGVRYGFAFLDKPPVNGVAHNWIKVGKILDFDDEDAFYEFRQSEKDKLPDQVTKAQMAIMERNLERLYRAIWRDDFIAYYTEHDQDYDRVLDIFVRANEGGTKLSKSDLLLSMITAKWDGINARDEIYGFVDRLNNELDRKNNLDKDFVMKTCLVLCDLPVQYKVENFNNKNLDLIRSKWPDIRNAIERAVNLANYFRIDRDTLTSANALIPIVYFLYHRPGVTLLESTPDATRNATLIRGWLAMTLLNNVFGGTSDNLLRDIRQVLNDRVEQPDFPVEAINERATIARRAAYFAEQTIDAFLAITYGKQTTFLALSLLYDNNHWGTSTVHQDHIFPKAAFTKKHLAEAGLDPDRQVRYLELANSIANLQLLSGSENQGKSDDEYEAWLKTRDQSYRAQHLIPADNKLLKFESFDKFISAREKLIRQRLEKLFPATKLPRIEDDE